MAVVLIVSFIVRREICLLISLHHHMWKVHFYKINYWLLIYLKGIWSSDVTFEWKLTNKKIFVWNLFRGRGETKFSCVCVCVFTFTVRILGRVACRADMQREHWLQSLQRKYINTKPLASLFSLVNISNTPRSGSCFQSPLCKSHVDVVFLTVLGQTAVPLLGSPQHPQKVAAQTQQSQAERSLLRPAWTSLPAAH